MNKFTMKIKTDQILALGVCLLTLSLAQAASPSTAAPSLSPSSSTGPRGGSVVHTQGAKLEFVNDQATGKLRAYTLKRAEPLPRRIRVTIEGADSQKLDVEMSALNPEEDLLIYQTEQGIEDSRIFGARGSSMMGLKFKIRF
jgi:hypothetical protein